MTQPQDVQPEDPANPGLNGQQNNGHLHNKIEALQSQIGQMAEEAKAQKNVKKLHLQTIVELHAKLEKQQAIEQPSSSSSRPRSLKFVICYIVCVLAIASFIGLIDCLLLHKRKAMDC